MGSDTVKPLAIATFEQHAMATDKLEPELDTALLGLVGEVGSLVSALKKKRRDTDGYFGYADAVLEELGDVLWYLSAVARRGGTSLVEAASRSIAPNGLGADPRLSDLEPRTRGDDAADRGFEIALLELAGEAGDLAKRFASGAYTDNVDALRGDIVKLLRPLGRAAAAADVSLDEAGARNIVKIEDRWPRERKPPMPADDGFHVDEQLPRQLRVEIYEREDDDSVPEWRQDAIPIGTQQGYFTLFYAVRGRFAGRLHLQDDTDHWRTFGLFNGPLGPPTLSEYLHRLVDEEGNGVVIESRMYQLIRQPAPVVDRQFEIEFLDAGLSAFSFTFG